MSTIMTTTRADTETRVNCQPEAHDPPTAKLQRFCRHWSGPHQGSLDSLPELRCQVCPFPLGAEAEPFYAVTTLPWGQLGYTPGQSLDRHRVPPFPAMRLLRTGTDASYGGKVSVYHPMPSKKRRLEIADQHRATQRRRLDEEGSQGDAPSASDLSGATTDDGSGRTLPHHFFCLDKDMLQREVVEHRARSLYEDMRPMPGRHLWWAKLIANEAAESWGWTDYALEQLTNDDGLGFMLRRDCRTYATRLRSSLVVPIQRPYDLNMALSRLDRNLFQLANIMANDSRIARTRFPTTAGAEEETSALTAHVRYKRIPDIRTPSFKRIPDHQRQPPDPHFETVLESTVSEDPRFKGHLGAQLRKVLFRLQPELHYRDFILLLAYLDQNGGGRLDKDFVADCTSIIPRSPPQVPPSDPGIVPKEILMLLEQVVYQLHKRRAHFYIIGNGDQFLVFKMDSTYKVSVSPVVLRDDCEKDQDYWIDRRYCQEGFSGSLYTESETSLLSMVTSLMLPDPTGDMWSDSPPDWAEYLYLGRFERAKRDWLAEAAASGEAPPGMGPPRAHLKNAAVHQPHGPHSMFTPDDLKPSSWVPLSQEGVDMYPAYTDRFPFETVTITRWRDSGRTWDAYSARRQTGDSEEACIVKICNLDRFPETARGDDTSDEDGASVSMRYTRAEAEDAVSREDIIYQDVLEPLRRRLGHDHPAPAYYGTWCNGPIRMMVLEDVGYETIDELAECADDREHADWIRERVREAYDRLHEEGLVHGDVHPRHILLVDGPDWKVKIIDFEGSMLTSDPVLIAEDNQRVENLL